MTQKETATAFIQHVSVPLQQLRALTPFPYFTNSAGVSADELEAKSEVGIVDSSLARGYNLRAVIAGGDDLLCVGVWNSGNAFNQIHNLRPRVVLLDMDAFAGSAVEVITRIKQQVPELQIIVMTHARDPVRILPAFRAGASGHLRESASPSEIRDAIRVVLGGGAVMDAEIASYLIDFVRHPSRYAAQKFNLSPREKEILDLICTGLTDKEIAQHLGISRETVRSYVKNVYDKLGVRSRTAAAMKYHGFEAVFETSKTPGTSAGSRLAR